MVLSRYQMFKAVYFHKTVRSAEVMLLEAMSLADNELGLTSLDLNDYMKLTDEFVVSSLLSLPPKNSDLKRAKKFAEDYQNRKLLKCVFEKILTAPGSLNTIGNDEIRRDLSKKSKVDENEIFVDSSITHSIALTSQKTKSQSVSLVTMAPRLHAI